MQTREELSHNLRTPLTSIRLALEVCIRRANNLPPEALQELLNTALEQTKKLEQAVMDTERDAMDEPVEDESNVIVLHEESNGPIRVRGGKAV